MEKDPIVLVRIDWKDREGNRWSDASDLKELQETARQIRLENGTVLAVKTLEKR
jgi:hypothetical protein